MYRQTIWSYATTKLFCSETGLFYDYLSSTEQSRRFDYLPNVAECRAGFPNPCGWGTGMEDCMLNAGSALEIIVRLKVDPEWTLTAKIVDGIKRCTTVHGQPGFVVRGISPRSSEGYYINSSRDQFTLAVYGLWRLIHANAVTLPDMLRKECSVLLTTIADYCRKQVTPANDYDLRRLDGRPALVSRLWQCDSHEMLRLPMIYAAAYAASGATVYRELAERFLPEGIERTLTMSNAENWWDLPTVQMQLSVLLLRDCGIFPAYVEQMNLALDQIAAFALPHFELTLKEAIEFTGSWYEVNGNWRQMPMRLYADSVTENGRNAAWQGTFYVNPIFPSAYYQANSLLRRLGSWLTVIQASSAELIGPDLRARLEVLLSGIDFLRCTGDGPLKLLHGLSMQTASRSNKEVLP